MGFPLWRTISRDMGTQTLQNVVAGVKTRPKGFRELIKKHLLLSQRMDWEEAPPLKEFKPRCSNLPILSSYGGGDLGDAYWDTWNKKPYEPRRVASLTMRHS